MFKLNKTVKDELLKFKKKKKPFQLGQTSYLLLNFKKKYLQKYKRIGKG